MASGGSVLALKYDGGVLLACDTLLSYGSLAKWANIPRIKILGEHSAICAQGDYADFQDVSRQLEAEMLSQSLLDDGVKMTPKELFSFLHRTIYSKRCDFEPALCQFIVIGHYDGEAFIGSVDDIGTRWTDDYAGSGYGAHFGVPLLRKALEVKNGKLTRDEALAVIQDALRVLFYRECRAVNKFQIADASNGKVVISEPFSVDTKWDFAGFDFEKTAIIR